MDSLLEQSNLVISEPAGEVHPGSLDQPLLVIAGGSGAAQAFACAEHRAQFSTTAPTTVLWCADQPQDLYSQDILASWCQLITKVDDRRTPENEGLMWLKDHGAEYSNAHVVLAGSPGFVYAATDVLLEIGFNQAQLQADAYAYAPRE
jgi:CDP-4-dehydro-6-deoxyglucose reductase